MAKTGKQNGAGYIPRDNHRIVTDKIIAALEAGTVPWRKPWDPDKAGGPAAPRNATTGVRYRGINTVMLGMSSLAFGAEDPRWATYNQATEQGWQVRCGSTGTMAVFFKRLEVNDTSRGEWEEETRRIPLLRTFTLFHASQIDGIPEWVPPTVAEAPWRTPEAVETIVRNSGAVVRVGGERAFYSPSTDHIQMPPTHAFGSAHGYAGTMMHELGHWTGAKTRLDRGLCTSFGSHDYSREELRAEIAQMMTCAELGIGVEHFDNGVSYLAGWLKALKEDRKEIFRAAADAQRIADMLLGFHPAYAAQDGQPADDATSAAQDGTAAEETTRAAA